jgi:hypothetical protein
VVQSQSRQIVHETLSRKKNITKEGWWSGVGPEFKLQYSKKKKIEYFLNHQNVEEDFFKTSK